MSIIYRMLQEPRKLVPQYLTRRGQICCNHTEIKIVRGGSNNEEGTCIDHYPDYRFCEVCMAEYGYIRDLPELSATMSGSRWFLQ